MGRKLPICMSTICFFFLYLFLFLVVVVVDVAVVIVVVGTGFCRSSDKDKPAFNQAMAMEGSEVTAAAAYRLSISLITLQFSLIGLASRAVPNSWPISHFRPRVCHILSFAYTEKKGTRNGRPKYNANLIKLHKVKKLLL